MDGDRPSLLERAPGVRRHRLDMRDDYRMAEIGILTREDRVELIDGEIVETAPIGSGHGGAVNALNDRLNRLVGERAPVSVQGALRLSDTSEPQPDILLLHPRADFDRTAHPTAADVLLLVEVPRSSLAYGRRVKLPLYARHAVPEVWIVNIAEGVIEVYRTPQDETYTDTATAALGATREPLLLPGLSIAVAEVLG
ncbi:Uma2 family endonuclease [Paracraurococcus ruber]|uniref:Putative restriction endonuclease domain-containing protein n=1 Tax=Paracraurococcus ruber TaxID=77675 RepID=A0ABS1CUF5_9PROT|nr:Uma2 family endonuclease [Paracraurococcus ruber]MBK1657454.1 hypothetical protein [Paracraurococcus ruber]